MRFTFSIILHPLGLASLLQNYGLINFRSTKIIY